MRFPHKFSQPAMKFNGNDVPRPTTGGVIGPPRKQTRRKGGFADLQKPSVLPSKDSQFKLSLISPS